MKAYQILTISTSSVGLNPEIFKHGMEKSQRAMLAVTGDLAYRVDGNPVAGSADGINMTTGDIITLTGFNEINFFQAIRIGGADAVIKADFS